MAMLPTATFGKYQVRRVLGRGGMGTVYEARDPQLNRKVALKTMIPGLLGDPGLRARFLREAQAAGSLNHRNIVTDLMPLSKLPTALDLFESARDRHVKMAIDPWA